MTETNPANAPEHANVRVNGIQANSLFSKIREECIYIKIVVTLFIHKEPDCLV